MFDISPSRSGEYRCSSFNCLLLRTYRERCHQTALKRQYPPVADHLVSDPERVLWRQLASGLLQGNGVQVAPLEDGVTLGETVLDAILHRLDGRPAALAGEQSQCLIGTEPIAARGVPPHVLQVGSVSELLRSAVLEREVAQLLGDTGDLEILAVPPRRPLDRIPLIGEFLSECGTVKRTHLTRRTKHRPRRHRDDPVILAYRAGDDDVAVELRIGRVGT